MVVLLSASSSRRGRLRLGCLFRDFHTTFHYLYAQVILLRLEWHKTCSRCLATVPAVVPSRSQLAWHTPTSTIISSCVWIQNIEKTGLLSSPVFPLYFPFRLIPQFFRFPLLCPAATAIYPAANDNPNKNKKERAPDTFLETKSLGFKVSGE